MSKTKFDKERARQEVEALSRYIAIREANKATFQQDTQNKLKQQFEQDHPGYSQRKVDDLKEELAQLKQSAQVGKGVHFALQSKFDDALEAIKFAYNDAFKRKAKDYKTKDGQPGIELSFKNDAEAKAFFTKMAKEHDFIVKDSKGIVLYRAHNGILKDVPRKAPDPRFLAEEHKKSPASEQQTEGPEQTTESDKSPSLAPTM